VAWAQGLNRRGGVEFTDDHDHGRAAKMKGFWVGGEEDGLPHSVVYARKFGRSCAPLHIVLDVIWLTPGTN
jgi:hypothetical protein